MMFLAAWIIEISPCLFVIHLKEEQHKVIKTGNIEDEIKFKYQRLEKLKAEIEDLKDQREEQNQEDLDEYGLPIIAETFQGDYEVIDSVVTDDYTDKFLENKGNMDSQGQDDEEATVTDEEETTIFW